MRIKWTPGERCRQSRRRARRVYRCGRDALARGASLLATLLGEASARTGRVRCANDPHRTAQAHPAVAEAITARPAGSGWLR
ncbi:MAG TPA: hypothetical protein VFD43_01755 [Planctomycetota bacterium]|nr:hypothetical protein [Planctomycetota bacterium]